MGHRIGALSYFGWKYREPICLFYGAIMRYPMEGGSVELDIEVAREAIRLAEQIATLVKKG